MTVCLIYIESPGSASEKCVFYEQTKDQKTREQTQRSIYAKALFLKRKRAHIKI